MLALPLKCLMLRHADKNIRKDKHIQKRNTDRPVHINVHNPFEVKHPPALIESVTVLPTQGADFIILKSTRSSGIAYLPVDLLHDLHSLLCIEGYLAFILQ